MRVGAEDSEIAAVAEGYAESNPLRRFTDGAGGSDWAGEIEIGTWDWFLTEPGTDRFEEGGGRAAVRVDLSPGVGGQISLLWAPIVARMFGMDSTDGLYAQGGTATATFEHRDLVVTVDVSRNNADHLPEISDAAQDFLDQLNAFNLPQDRLAGVTYAGAAERLVPLLPVPDNLPELRAAFEDLQPCYVGTEAWFNYHRFVAPEDDAIAPSRFDYRVLDPTADPTGDHYLAWTSTSLESTIFRTLALAMGVDVARLLALELGTSPLTEAEEVHRLDVLAPAVRRHRPTHRRRGHRPAGEPRRRPWCAGVPPRERAGAGSVGAARPRACSTKASPARG